jgi:uncharacterized membrane protein YkvA (DUF1232 family)
MDQTRPGAERSAESSEGNEMSPEEVSQAMNDASDDLGPVSKDRADRYYDRIRRSIASYLEKKGKAAGKAGEFLLLVPDVFILLWRLANDGRVAGKHKVLLVTGLVYFLSPFDLMPEALLGPMGYMDDLVFGVYILNRMVGDTDVSVIRDHWSGSGDVLETIQKVLNAADGLVGGDFLKKIKKMMG